MKSVRYLDEARAEFLHEVQYFSAVSPGLGKRFDEAVQKAEAPLSQLKTAPQAAIINIGGLTAHTGTAHRVHVVTAKAGLVGMTRALAHDLAAHGITVNCVAPGLIDTVRQSSSASAAPRHHATHKALLGRRGTAQEVLSRCVSWRATRRASSPGRCCMSTAAPTWQVEPALAGQDGSYRLPMPTRPERRRTT